MALLRIAVVGVPYFTGGGTVTRALVKFLEGTRHQVRMFGDYYMGPHTAFQKRIRGLLGWRLGMSYRRRLIEQEFTALVKQVREFNPDVLIAVEQGEVLLQEFKGVRKIFYANAPTGHEVYFQLAKSAKLFRWDAYETACRKELEYYHAADAVIFCWNTHVDYVKKWVYQGTNLVKHPGLGWYGCESQPNRAQFGYPPFLVYMGATGAYWNNPDLLARVANQLPYALHFYGPTPPASALELNYQGFVESTDVLLRYQIGLHTATDEPLRQYGFASKLMTYLAYGLPTLSPGWQLMTHQLEGVIAYNEQNLYEQVEMLLEPAMWQTRADAAYAQADKLAWGKVLQPLLELLS